MAPGGDLARFPEFLPQSNPAGALRYQRVENGYAVLGPLPDAVRAHVVHSFSSGQVHVCRGEPPPAYRLPPATTLTAIYRLEGTGPEAVPTGRLFVRFAERVSAQSRATDLASLGLRIDVIPVYAPHAAWLRAEDGNSASALLRIEALTHLADVAHVEPEILTEPQRRT